MAVIVREYKFWDRLFGNRVETLFPTKYAVCYFRFFKKSIEHCLSLTIENSDVSSANNIWLEWLIFLKNNLGPRFKLKVGMNQEITISNFRFHIFEPPKIFQMSVNLQLQIYSLDVILFSCQNFLYSNKYWMHTCLDVAVFLDPLLLY